MKNLIFQAHCIRRGQYCGLAVSTSDIYRLQTFSSRRGGNLTGCNG